MYERQQKFIHKINASFVILEKRLATFGLKTLYECFKMKQQQMNKMEYEENKR